VGATEVAAGLRSWLDIVVFASGMAGVVLTQWRTTIGVKNEVANLTKQVEKQNGTLSEHAKQLVDIQVTCARQHGILPWQAVRRVGEIAEPDE